MPRKPDLDPPTRLTLRLPETLRAKVDLILFSELEGRVPQGRYQEFFIERLVEYFSNRPLSLDAYGIAGMISGPKDVIEALERKLKDANPL